MNATILELTPILYSLSKWRLLCSLNGQIGTPQLRWLLTPKMITILWACSPISFNTCFLVSIVMATSIHKSLNNRCWDYYYVGFWHVYLTPCVYFQTQFHSYFGVHRGHSNAPIRTMYNPTKSYGWILAGKFF